MSSRSTLVLVRHGHTAGNGDGMTVPMSGWTDTPLSPRGVRDAEAVAAQLAVETPPTLICSSPLQRALHTAEKIRERCAAPLERDPDLREIHCGEADGLSLELVKRRYPDHWRRNLEQSDPEFRWPGGECYRELRERALRCLNRLAQLGGGRVVVVTHAGVISQLLGHFRGVNAARWEAFRPRNGSITEVVLSADRLDIIRFDEMPAWRESTGPSSPRSAA